MPVLAYTKKMLDAITPDVDDARRALFEGLVYAIGRQIRPHYHKRHAPEQTVTQLVGVFERFWTRAPDAVLINAESSGRLLVLTTVMSDQPFIVDTLRMRLQARGATNINAFNAIVSVQRNDAGEPTNIGSGPLESIIRMEIEGLDGCAPPTSGCQKRGSL